MLTNRHLALLKDGLSDLRTGAGVSIHPVGGGGEQCRVNAGLALLECGLLGLRHSMVPPVRHHSHDLSDGLAIRGDGVISIRIGGPCWAAMNQHSHYSC